MTHELPDSCETCGWTPEEGMAEYLQNYPDGRCPGVKFERSPIWRRKVVICRADLRRGET